MEEQKNTQELQEETMQAPVAEEEIPAAEAVAEEPVAAAEEAAPAAEETEAETPAEPARKATPGKIAVAVGIVILLAAIGFHIGLGNDVFALPESSNFITIGELLLQLLLGNDGGFRIHKESSWG